MKLRSQNVFLLALLIILSSGVSLILHHPGFALRLMIISFWILAAGTLIYILELKNEK